MSQRAADLYNRPAPEDAVPNLLLNTTEAGTGQIIPYTTVRIQGLATPFRRQAEIDNSSFDAVEPSPSQMGRLSLQDRMADDRIPLSTAAIVSARFPYLTPAGRISYSDGNYVDGGYFENSGTYLLSGIVQNLIGEQASYPAGKSPQLDAARRAVFVVIVIESEPCTRNSLDTGCDEDSTTESDSWSEALSPLRALLSTRDVRAEYSLDSLNAVSSLIEQFSYKYGGPATTGDTGTSCDYPVCAVTLQVPQPHAHRHSAVLGAFERRAQIDGQRRRRDGNGRRASGIAADSHGDPGRHAGCRSRAGLLPARALHAGGADGRAGLFGEIGAADARRSEIRQQISRRFAEIDVLLVHAMAVFEHRLDVEEAGRSHLEVDLLLDAERAVIENVGPPVGPRRPGGPATRPSPCASR